MGCCSRTSARVWAGDHAVTAAGAHIFVVMEIPVFGSFFSAETGHTETQFDRRSAYTVS